MQRIHPNGLILRSMTFNMREVGLSYIPTNQNAFWKLFNGRSLHQTVKSSVADPQTVNGNKYITSKYVLTPSTPNRQRDAERRSRIERTKSMRQEDDIRRRKMGKAKASLRTSAKNILSNIDKPIYIWDGITLNEMGIQLKLLPKQFMKLIEEKDLIYDQIDYSLYEDEAIEVCTTFNLPYKIFELPSEGRAPHPLSENNIKKYERRPPVVTILGHVDHGKTTLLDALRKSRIADGEAGGITQRIGAFHVKVKDKGDITFIDTPGHAAFSDMRERGAKVTDIVVLVVAADDGVMPQTIESIRFANDSRVPIIVAITKCDRPEADSSKVKEMLMNYGLYSEDLGGETPMVEISAKTGEGLTDLMETVSLLSETLPLPCVKDKAAAGFVIESSQSIKQGITATILTTRGIFSTKDNILSEKAVCRIKSMVDENGKAHKSIGPGYAATITGWKALPSVGDLVLGVSSAKVADKIIIARKNLEVIKSSIAANESQLIEEDQRLRALLLGNKTNLEDLNENENENNENSRPNCNIVLKADALGSLQAFEQCINAVNQKKIDIQIVSSGVGPIHERDVDVAKDSNAILVAFGVNTNGKPVQKLIDRNGIKVFSHQVIYYLLDNIKEHMLSLLPPEQVREEVGSGKVLKTFNVTTEGVKEFVIGCSVGSGLIQKKNGFLSSYRNNELILDNISISSLRHFKNNVEEVKVGNECGIGIGSKELDVQEGDIIKCTVEKFVEATLD